MSDLISRKKIRDFVKVEINPYGKPFEGTAYELGLKIIRYIDSMDSAYDLDKVVEELEATKGYACYGMKCDECKYTHDCFEGEKSQEMAIDKAIEIVKQGGVSDDACEWKTNDNQHMFAMWETECGTQTMIQKLPSYKYCPYCGKKIKVVVE